MKMFFKLGMLLSSMLLAPNWFYIQANNISLLVNEAAIWTAATTKSGWDPCATS